MKLLYYENAYIKDFETRTTRVEGDVVYLEETAFYPRGGGQPSDRGTVESAKGTGWVVGVSKAGGEVEHRLEGDLPGAGDVVTGYLDWDLRYRLMRLHSALHVMSAVVYRTWGATVTGANIADDGSKARMDFALEGKRVADLLEEIGTGVNADIRKEAAVKTYELPRAEAMEIPDLIRTRISLLPEGLERVRIVEIEGVDLQADGGTHVSNTAEVGRVRILGGSNKGKINRRVEIALDDPQVQPRSDAPPVAEG